jgi:phosphinothricin acetyltransferase
MDSSRRVRAARLEDAAAIARIYSEGIADRIATFETQPRTAEDVRKWFDGRYPIAVAEDGGEVAAFAAASQFRTRECYAGVAELSVYVARSRRGRGAGRAVLDELLRQSEACGLWKIIAGVLSGNAASLRLLGRAGFREIGVYRKHAKLDGAWRDVVLLERLLGEAARDAAADA